MARMPSIAGRETGEELGDPALVVQVCAGALLVSAILRAVHGEYAGAAFSAVFAAGMVMRRRSRGRPYSRRVGVGLMLVLAAGLVALETGSSPITRALGLVLTVTPLVLSIWLAHRKRLPPA